MKKYRWFLVVGIIIVVLILIKSTEFERLRTQREAVVDMIIEGELSVQENGLITLPDNLKKLSDSQQCIMVCYNEKTAIYFYTYRGMLENSKGYVFITNKIDYKDYINTKKFIAKKDFIKDKKISSNWYSVSTG